MLSPKHLVSKLFAVTKILSVMQKFEKQSKRRVEPRVVKRRKKRVGV